MVSLDSPQWFPIDIYSNRMSISHRSAVIATQKMFSSISLLHVGTNYGKSKVHWMTSKWPWMLQGQRYFIPPARPKILTPFCSTITRFPDNWGFWFLHRLQWWIWNFRTKIVKDRKLEISKIPRNFVRTIGRKNSGQVWKFLAVIWVAFWNFHCHWVPCLKKLMKFVKISIFKISKIPKAILWVPY